MKSKNSKPNAIARALTREVLLRARRTDLQTYAQKLLLELCRIDTAPKPELAEIRDAEHRCFQILERELAKFSFAQAQAERRAIDPAIQRHPAFSPPRQGKASGKANSPEDICKGRSNLIYVVPGSDSASGQGSSVALNAHVDVVAPYFPPRVKNGVIFGRGACDDKGAVVTMMAALKVLSEVLAERQLQLKRNVVAMFVIEEETGGMGSLSLAVDRDLKKLYDVIVVGEPTSFKIHPANRGAVWYQAELKPPRGVSAFELFAFVNEELEKEGAAIYAESRHELFPQRPVQTCHGIIGPFGEHPSRICGKVEFSIQFAKFPDDRLEKLVHDCLQNGLAGYIGLYGDKTRVTDPETGKPLVARHLDIRRRGHGFDITVHGATGHMGAIRERDGAITKTAHLVRQLVYSKAKLAALGKAVQFELTGPAAGTLLLEGGQGFLPTHEIREVTDRLRQAIERGAENYIRRCGRQEPGTQVGRVAFDKLRNAAYAGDPDSPAMQNAQTAAKECGIWRDEPVVGWTVSCDARLFANEYPGMPVLTFGPGALAVAHSNEEQIKVADVAKAAEFLALFLLRETGTI